MLRKRRLGIAAVVAGTVVALVGAGGSAESTTLTTVATGTKAAPNRQVTPRTVTLLTGDRVTVVDNGKATVERGKDRAGVVFLTRQIGGHLHVVPSDAVAPLRAGRLDGRLFDVTALLSYGYDRRADLPLIVTGDQGAKALAGQGATVVRELPAIGGRAVRADRTGAFWRALTGGDPHATALRGGVSTVYLDGLRRPTLDQSVPQIGAPAAWAAGFDGKGVTVAV